MPTRARASWIDRVLPNVPGTRVRAALLGFTAILLASVATAPAAETLPPPPPNHFNDYAGMVRRETATQLNQELAQFERDTSNQILVVIYQEMPSRSSVEDYTVRVAQSWRVGQKAKNNGAVLFVFQASRDLRIQVGYGLEGALPDALCKQIIEDEIVPRFRAGDFDAGLTAGVRGLIAATRGEYRGSGRLATDAASSGNGGKAGLVFTIILVVIVLSSLRSASRRGTVYGRRGRRTVWVDRGGWGGWGGGGGGWSGGSGGGGGGTFSSGGGSFGGGGAGGKW